MYKPYIQKIANILLVNHHHISRKGLLRGHLGVALFFYHYSRYMGIEYYEEIAGEIIDYVLSEQLPKMNQSFDEGAFGTGWCVNYLESNGFIETDDKTWESLNTLAMQKTSCNLDFDLECNTPVFSLGLFCCKKCNKKILENIISYLESILSETLCLCYINSIIYFLLCCIRDQRENQQCQLLLDKFITMANKIIKKEMCNSKDVIALKLILSKNTSENITGCLNTDILNDVYLNWQTVVYNDMMCKKSSLNLSEINKYIDQIECNVPSDSISLNGIASLGINLMQQDY